MALVNRWRTRVQKRIRVALELDLDADTIGGRLEGPEGQREFTGWLGLASALEQLLGSDPPEVHREGLDRAPERGGAP